MSVYERKPISLKEIALCVDGSIFASPYEIETLNNQIEK